MCQFPGILTFQHNLYDIQDNSLILSETDHPTTFDADNPEGHYIFIGINLDSSDDDDNFKDERPTSNGRDKYKEPCNPDKPYSLLSLYPRSRWSQGAPSKGAGISNTCPAIALAKADRISIP